MYAHPTFVPPEAATVTSPFEEPAQLISKPLKFDVTMPLALTTAGSTTVTLDIEIHPFASITVAVCVPAARPVDVVAELSPFYQRKLKGPTPPVPTTEAPPSE
jgi:hypothetical protein